MLGCFMQQLQLAKMREFPLKININFNKNIKINVMLQ